MNPSAVSVQRRSASSVAACPQRAPRVPPAHTQKTEATERLCKRSKECQFACLQVPDAGRFVKLPQILPSNRLVFGAHSQKMKQTDQKKYRALNSMSLNSVHHFTTVGARCIPLKQVFMRDTEAGNLLGVGVPFSGMFAY